MHLVFAALRFLIFAHLFFHQVIGFLVDTLLDCMIGFYLRT